MDALARPLRELNEDCKWFMRAHEIRLMRVRTTADMRRSVLHVLAQQESNRFNASPMLVLPDPHQAADAGWDARTVRLYEQHEDQRARWAEAGHPQPALAPSRPIEARGASGAAAFATTLAEIDRSWVAPASGTLVVLAPTVVADVDAWDRAVQALVLDRSLRRVRWVVVDLEHDTADALVDGLGARALRCRCTVDDDALLAQLERHLALLRAAPPGAPGPAQAGAAWPNDVRPPPRGKAKSLPPAALAAALREAGVPEVLGTDFGRQLKLHILGAAVALRRGDGAAAVREQRAAKDLCTRADRLDERLLMQLTLAGYLLTCNRADAALREYDDAAADAERNERWQAAAQARLACGALHAHAGALGEAAGSYRAAATLAERAKIVLLAIEAWRLAGQLALDHGREREATDAWRKAIALAEGDPALAPHSSAHDTALALAEVCRRRGLAAQAQALEAQALRFRSPPEDAHVARAEAHA